MQLRFRAVTKVGRFARTRIAVLTLLGLLVHPELWVTAVRQVVRIAPRHWWRRPPFLPLPEADYLRFRMETQYGTEQAAIDPADLIVYLRWCRHPDR